MGRVNDEVAGLLQEYADLLSLTGGDAFRVRTYQRAARAIAGHHSEVAPGTAAEVSGVGKAIAGKVDEILATGSFKRLEEARAEIPPGVRALTKIPGLGPRKAYTLFTDLGIDSPPALRAAIEAGKLRGMKGFGPKSEANLLAGIDLAARARERVLLSRALTLAETVIETLSALPETQRCTYAGSLRRGRETVRDLDILVATTTPGPIAEAFCELPMVAEVIARGDSKCSIRTVDGPQIDLRMVPPPSWGAALQYFTGSKEHNIRIRELAVQRGLKLSEYGVFADEVVLASETEEQVYAAIGMPWIPPTLREDRGEVAEALAGSVPSVVSVEDLRGDLHTHTSLTDGVSTLEEMVAAAAARGYSYYAVTDHAPDLVMQRMTLDKARAQRAQLRELQASYPDLRLLHGSELNIGPSGAVDWPASILAEFDVCVASVHSHFGLSRDEQTRRVITACENPHVHVIGHLTGRRVGKRPPIDLDLDAVFAAAARTNTALEINGGPERLDLRDEHIRLARRHGVRFAVDSDAHAVGQLDYVRYAVLTAQRGWAAPEECINTWEYERLRSFLA